MGVVVIPESYMGQTLQEADIKKALTDLNADFHFDMGGNLDIWHPYRSHRQGVFHLGRHVCSMDRGTIPEFKIWSMVEEYVRVPTHSLGIGDATNPSVLDEVIFNPDGSETRTGFSSIKRKQRDKILLVGWRHTFARILNKNIPNVTQRALEIALRVDLTWKEADGATETESLYATDQSLVVA